MPASFSTATGRSTSYFTNYPAGDVMVAGLPHGAAGSRAVSAICLSSIAGSFTVSSDIVSMLAAGPAKIAAATRNERPVFSGLDAGLGKACEAPTGY